MQEGVKLKKKRIIQLTAWLVVISIMGSYALYLHSKFYVYHQEVAQYRLFINDYDATAMASDNQEVKQVVYPESPFELKVEVSPYSLNEALDHQSKLTPNSTADSTTTSMGQVKDYLEPSLHINPSSDSVLSLAKALYKDETDALHKIQNTLKYFKKNLKHERQFGIYEKRYAAYENFDPMSTATDEEVIAAKKGTQVEKATLFASLMRSQGIPAKLVGGHIFADREGGFKVWVEVYLPQWGWLPIDPTRHRTGVDNRYIKLKEGLDWSDFGESLVEMHVGVERLNW